MILHAWFKPNSQCVLSVDHCSIGLGVFILDFRNEHSYRGMDDVGRAARPSFGLAMIVLRAPRNLSIGIPRLTQV